MQISNTPSDTKISSTIVLENNLDSLQEKRRDRLIIENSLFFYYSINEFNRYVSKLEKRDAVIARTPFIDEMKNALVLKNFPFCHSVLEIDSFTFY
ncbi:hypothetical protein Lbys_0208 [Leadbetterella byssophila DSM 17132]|uniref:Uncharacterized protein n=1 Tax=Leadbetterella byssophila (strain DSM 17132 / JCM 16389 / KACC 11308 / NBRC 106382 / 4M15) TaxID=649349 RepID=E4RU21_LEAB4|nr:hypothetical protein Lbys_0208 [Leadbetterella byssophila DSM 17132]